LACTTLLMVPVSPVGATTEENQACTESKCGRPFAGCSLQVNLEEWLTLYAMKVNTAANAK
jgi:hypothetical protein